MSRRRFRPAVRALTAVVGLGLPLGLAGCTSSDATQQRWATALERLDGVTAADWSRQAGSSISLAATPAVLTVSPALSPAQARAIAAESCRYDAAVTSVAVGIDEPLLGRNTVRQSELSSSACIPEAALVDFSRVTAAMQQLRPGYVGEFLVFGPEDLPSPPPGTEALVPALSVRAAATTDEMLLDAIRELHAQFDDAHFSFLGETSDDGGTLAATGAPITAVLTPAAELDRVLPLATAALRLERGPLTLTDTAVTVHVSSTDALAGPEMRAFRELGAELGVEAIAILTPLQLLGGVAPTPAELAEQQALVADILAIPGGANVLTSGQGAIIIVRDAAGVAAAAQLVTTAPEFAHELRIAADGSESWLAVRAGGRSAEQVSAAHAAAQRVQHELPGVARTAATLSATQATLQVFLTDEAAADAATVDTAREFLRPFHAEGTFDEIRVIGTGITFPDEPLS